MSLKNQESFPLEKILSISATDYFNIHKQKDPQKYETIGIQINGIDCRDWKDPDFSLKQEFAKRHVPNNAEVVVSYSGNTSLFVQSERVETFHHKTVKTYYVTYAAQGTALVPKK